MNCESTGVHSEAAEDYTTDELAQSCLSRNQEREGLACAHKLRVFDCLRLERSERWLFVSWCC